MQARISNNPAAPPASLRIHIAFLLAILLSSSLSIPTAAQTPPATTTTDIQADRLNITPITKPFLYHAGDDPQWADPSFDDSSWTLLNPSEEWGDQGLKSVHQMAWFRFRLEVPAETTSLVLRMPGISVAYQVFSEGKLAGQAGHLPPEQPQVALATQRIFTLPLAAAKASQGVKVSQGVQSSATKEVVVAIRIWQDPLLAGLVYYSLSSPMYVGSSTPVQAWFARSKAAYLLSQGNNFAQGIIALIVGAATLLLFFLTRRNFYIWYAINLLATTLEFPLNLTMQHFGMGHLSSIYVYTLLDFLAGVTFIPFVLGALGSLRWRWLVPLLLMQVIAELGPLFYIRGVFSEAWADGIYFVFIFTAESILVAFLIWGWRNKNPLAKLLFFPYLLPFLSGSVANLAYFLTVMNVPHASALQFLKHELLSQPFSITVEDAGGIISTLGMLTVLVYQFAKSNREEQRLKTALQTAHDIQYSLVPVDIPRIGGLHTEIVYLAAEEVGGDFCQILPRADGSTLIVIGDVSGKGLQAAMLGTLAVGALRSMADEAIGPAEALGRLNNVLLRTSNRRFITCLCMVLTPSGEVLLANAGHLAPYLDGVEQDTLPGLPLGIVPDMQYEQTSFFLPATARLTLISDGVVEARSETGELYGFERTCCISHLSAKEIAAEANNFGQEDDITVITLDWLSPATA